MQTIDEVIVMFGELRRRHGGDVRVQFEEFPRNNIAAEFIPCGGDDDEDIVSVRAEVNEERR